MEEAITCTNKTCNKVLKEDMEIEYSEELTSFFCSPDCATYHYFDYMRSVPLDNSIDNRNDVYFKNGILFHRED